MTNAFKVLVLTAAVLTAGLAVAADRPSGYLAPGTFDVTTIIEPAPRPDDPRYEADRQIFKATRALAGSERYRMATNDADASMPAMLKDFSCAAGITLTATNAPRLVALVQRASIDTGGQSGRAKDFYKRQRPYVIDKGAICQPAEQLFDKAHNRASYDYPSGHSTWGWTWALILAGAMPERAQQILARGRAYGDSRFVCGAHNESAVEAGMASAAATMAVVQAQPEFQADLAAARAELAQLRAGDATAPAGCEAEAALMAQRVMPRLDHQRGRK